MKKFSLVLVALFVILCCFGCFAYAEPQASEMVNETINTVGNTAMDVALNILDQATTWSLPFCAIFVVFGAVQFFIMGIRNLYKKRQGLLLMFGSMTFYVILVVVDFVLTLSIR
ncbi:MAG: hypothetical protein E7314_04215 [Clostridiales bacterium]|nr:hypothetical protein [Clostridiales bacterium]